MNRKPIKSRALNHENGWRAGECTFADAADFMMAAGA
jgi:hypothetical protein